MNTTAVQPAELHAALAAAQALYRAGFGSSWAARTLRERGLDNRLAAGYAPPGRTTTVDHLRTLGIGEETMIAAGIARTSDRGLVDAIRDRLTIPIHHDGALVGWTARTGGERPDPDRKWINTPATDLYRKSEVLLSDPRGRRPDPRAVPILVEGALDVAAIAQVTDRIGTYAAAPCGTALTADHVDQLYRHHRHASTPIMVAFDADAAGERATLKAWDLLTSHPDFDRRQLLAVDLPTGADPADLVQAHRGDDLRRRILSARPLAERVADLRTSGIHSSDNLMRAAAAARQLLTDDWDRLYQGSRQRYLDHLAGRLGIDGPTIRLMAADQIAQPLHAGFTPMAHRSVDAVPAPIARPPTEHPGPVRVRR